MQIRLKLPEKYHLGRLGREREREREKEKEPSRLSSNYAATQRDV